MKIHNHFGVEETLQCGVQHTTSFWKKLPLLHPFICIPIQIGLLLQIRKKAAFLSKRSFRTFVRKYIFYLIFLMSLQCMEVIIIMFGSFVNNYYDYIEIDGYQWARYIYLIGDQISFTMLCLGTLIEPVFKHEVYRLYLRFLKPHIIGKKKRKASNISKNGSTMRESQQIKLLEGEEGQLNVPEGDYDFESEEFDSDDSKNFEVLDQKKLNELLYSFEGEDEEDMRVNRNSDTMAQKQSKLLINAILVSIYHCMTEQDIEIKERPRGRFYFITKYLRSEITDKKHIIDLVKFQKENPNVCISEQLKSESLPIKIQEYHAENMKLMRLKSGFMKEQLQKAFAPASNAREMDKFQEGSGKSSSFFFFTSNNQFAIKTLKENELKLLTQSGFLKRYY